jgi:hypothetical protein
MTINSTINSSPGGNGFAARNAEPLLGAIIDLGYISRFLPAIFGAIFLGVFGAPLSAQTQTNPHPQILFVHLRLTNGAVQLVSTNLRPGLLKSPATRRPRVAVTYEVLSIERAMLWKGTIPHPAFLDLENPSPDAPHQLERRLIRRESIDFTVRIPFQPEAEKVEFYETDPGKEKSAATSLGSVYLRRPAQE